MGHYGFPWVNKTFPKLSNPGVSTDFPRAFSRLFQADKGPFQRPPIQRPDFGGFMAWKCWFLGIFGPSRGGKRGGPKEGPSDPQEGNPLKCRKKRKSQTACKPGSVPAGAGDGHSSGTPVTGRLARPTRASTRKPACRNKSGVSPLFGLAPGGVYPATPVTGGAVRSYRTLSPLPRTGAR